MTLPTSKHRTQPPPLNQSARPTVFKRITQVVQTVYAKVNFQQLVLKPGAKVPELWVKENASSETQKYPLLGDRYLLGRSSQCDIPIKNSLVSKIHLSLSRDSQEKPGLFPKRNHFIIKDEDSANGIYQGKRRVNNFPLHHGDVFSLGPPQLADTAKIQYNDPPPLFIRVLRYTLFGIGGLTTLFILYVLYEWTNFQVHPLPDLINNPVIVYARDGITPLRKTNTNAHYELNSLSKFSPYLEKALIASEDSRFYWHFGVDPIGVGRAVVMNIKSDMIREGASTITQQLARSVFRDYVGTADSAARKLREAIVAFKLETFYSKDDLLLAYLNRVFLGLNLYGFEDASRFYFDKSASDLTLSEAATLVGILPAPNSFNPVQSYDQAVKQRNGVLLRLERLGMISAKEADLARRSRIEVNPKAIEFLRTAIAPYYYDQVFMELPEILGEDLAREGNFLVETSLDPAIQAIAEEQLTNTLKNQGATQNFRQGAIVTLDSQTGEILALVGGADYKNSQFNRVSQAQRQPGSTFKVFAYIPALESGISPYSSHSCKDFTWEGQSYAGCERSSGNIDLMTAIAQSENVVALRLAKEVGLNKVIETAQRLGIKSELKSNPGLVLGESEVNLLEMTGAFATLANQGVANRPHVIKKIIDSNECKDASDTSTCRCIYSYFPDPNCSKNGNLEANRPVLTPNIADTMTNMLQASVRKGTGRPALLSGEEAGKTGTTNDNVDLWFIGYIPNNLVTGVWLGNDDNSPTNGSSAQAAQLWADYMSRISP